MEARGPGKFRVILGYMASSKLIWVYMGSSLKERGVKREGVGPSGVGGINCIQGLSRYGSYLGLEPRAPPHPRDRNE